MPGIIGCIKSSGTKKEVLAGRQALKYLDAYKDDFLYEDESICCSRTHMNIVGEKASPVVLNDNVYSWVEGEFYNIESIRTQFGIQEKTEAAILAEAYEKEITTNVLAEIDGYFVAVIYDKQKERLNFISDRLGLKPLFIWQENTKLAWSSEIKGLFSFHQFPKRISNEGFQCFYQNGHFLGDSTWFKAVSQLSASTFLVFSLKEKKIIQKKRYWSWDRIKQIDISQTEIVNRLSLLFKEAVRKRIQPENQSFTLGLSGGLDSRAILATLPKELFVESYTFGIKNCQDIKYAKRVSKIASVPHHSFELNKGNWLNDRVESIWKSDAALSFLHFHFGQYQEQITSIGKVMLNGFVGDLILGGSWIQNSDKRISAEYADQRFAGCSFLDDPSQDFYNINNEDPYFINNRVRRFTANGFHEIKYFESRAPFVDNKIIEFIYSVSDSFRVKDKVYDQYLLKSFPQFFQKIPKQGLGLRLGEEESKWKVFFKKASKAMLRKIGYNTTPYTDYHKWIQKDWHIFNQILTSKNAIYSNYIQVLEAPEQDLQKTARLITAEIWFQQAFNENFKNTGELLRLKQK